MPSSFTLSEFSELVSSALRGRVFEDDDDGLDEAPAVSRGGGRVDASSKCTNKHPSDSENNARLGNSNSPHHRSPYIYHTHYNSAHDMLLVAPPGQLPPSATPILAATMSTIDLGTNCLSLGIGMGSTGCGGTFSKSALEAIDTSNTHATTTPTTQTTPSSPSTPSPSPHRHRPLALFAKIKRQLSKPNVAFPSPLPSPTNPSHPNAFLVPSADLYYTPPAAQMRRSDRVSFAPKPSFHSASPAGTEAATPESASLLSTSMSNNISAAPNRHPKQKNTGKQQRRRRRHSTAESDYSFVSLSAPSTSPDSGSALSFAGPSTYSDESAVASGGGASVTFSEDVGIPSIIGSSASFFAALDHGMDGRRGRRGSGEGEDDDDGSGLDELARFEGRFAFPDGAGYFSGGRQGSDPEENDTSQELDADAHSVQSFVPYLPLVIQHERRQQGRDARVSLDDVASLSGNARSRTSTASRTSSSTAASGAVPTRRTHAVVRAPDGAVRVRRHVPPPLHPSPSRSERRGDARGVMHPYVLEQQYSPTSSASSRSPITPETPFFTASEASLEDDNEEGESDDASRISPSATRRSRKGDHEDKVLSARLSMDTFGHRTTASSFHPAPKPPSHVRVSVHPPTPTTPDLVPVFVATSPPTPEGAVDTHIHRGEDDNNHRRSTSNASAAKRRARQNVKSKSPPLSPPPSGPLPLLPASPPSSAASLTVKVKAASGSQRDSLVTQSSVEYSTHRHPSPFAHTLSESESELWGEEAVLNVSGDSTGIPFEYQHNTTAAVSAGGQHLLFSAHPFISELGHVSVVESAPGGTTESESDYASFSSSHSHSHSPSHSSSTNSGESDSASSDPSASASEETPSESEHRSRAAAILEANTRANADGFFMPVEKIKIEIGRQQAPPVTPPKTKTKTRAAAAGRTRSGGEWTLGLGLVGLEVPALSSSSSSSSSSSAASGFAKAFPALAGVDEAAASTLLVKKRSTVGSCITPSVFVTAAAEDRRSLRERTQSESALGAGARWKDLFGAEAKSAVIAPTPNEDWTLSLPLPSFKKLRKLPGDVIDTDPILSTGRHSYPTRMGCVEILVTDVDANIEDIDMTSAENADASSDTDDLDLDLYPADSDLLSTESSPLDPEPVILSVPRLVTRGSGIERATSASEPRPRTRSITLEDAEVELLEPGYAAAHAQAKASADANLAKLNTLSADLARFNEMLREGGSRLRQSKVPRRRAESKGFGEERSASAFSHVAEGGRADKRIRSALKHARSYGVLDEAPPKSTILRMASVGDLLSADNSRAKVTTKATTKAVLHDFGLSPSPSITPALIDNSPTLPQPDTPIVAQKEPLQGSSTSTSRPSSSGSNAPTITPSLARTSWRNVSGNSGSSSSTVTATPANTNTKVRATLPFAPPSAFAYKAPTKVEVANGTVGGSITEGVVPAQTRPGLASGSALNRKNSTHTLLRSPSSAKTKTKPVEPVTSGDSSNAPKPEDAPAHQDDTVISASTTVEPSSQVTHSRTSISSTASTATTSPVTTPTQASVPLPALSICTSPLPSPSRPRCQSASSTSSKDTMHSSATLTPTLSPNYDSSTLPTPLASSFPAPPTTHPMASSFGEALRVRLTAAGTQPTASKEVVAVKALERKSESSSISSSPKGMVLTIEERIRRLQELGMEAVVVRGTANSPNSNVSKDTKEKEKEKEVDSDHSDFYYSARSSFSSQR